MKILLLTKYFPPEPGAGSTRAYEHAKYWTELGADVTVLTCFPHYPDGIIPDEYKGYSYLEEEINGIKVVRTFTYATANKGKVRRSLGFFSFMLSSVIQGFLRLKKFDVIIATSPPITVGISGMLLSMLKKIPFVFEVRDLWPDSIVQLGEIKNRTIIKSLEFFEILMYKYALLVVCVSDAFIDIVHSKGIPLEKIKIFKNGVDLSLFNPSDFDIDLAEQLKLKNKFVVGYFGTFGLAHALDKVLLAARNLQNNEKIHFLLIGDGAESEKLKKIKEEFNLENVTILPMIKKEELRRYYSIADVMLVPLKNIPIFESVLPSKIFEIMAMKKPIILSVKGEAKKLVEQAGAGKFAEPENPNDLAEKITEAFENPEWIKQAGENGRSFVEKYFNRKKIAKDYLDLLSDSLKK